MNIKDFLEHSQNLALEQSMMMQKEAVEEWKKVADKLALSLDCLIDDRNNMKNWFRAHDALKSYEEMSKK